MSSSHRKAVQECLVPVMTVFPRISLPPSLQTLKFLLKQLIAVSQPDQCLSFDCAISNLRILLYTDKIQSTRVQAP